MNEDEALLEDLAAVVHDSWSGWAHWMLAMWDQTHSSGETFQDRWRRQIATPYRSLSEHEKESDRAEARKILARLAAEHGSRRAVAWANLELIVSLGRHLQNAVRAGLL